MSTDLKSIITKVYTFLNKWVFRDINTITFTPDQYILSKGWNHTASYVVTGGGGGNPQVTTIYPLLITNSTVPQTFSFSYTSDTIIDTILLNSKISTFSNSIGLAKINVIINGRVVVKDLVISNNSGSIPFLPEITIFSRNIIPSKIIDITVTLTSGVLVLTNTYLKYYAYKKVLL